jgi:TPR repeat protein
LTLAAVRGDARAQSRLATLYKEGLGAPRDPAIAIDLLQRAAAQRYAPAMANLARMYAERVGVERDDVRAYALLHAALQIGMPNDMRDASYDLLGSLAARLNEVQRPKAHQLSRKISAVPLRGRDTVLQR